MDKKKFERILTDLTEDWLYDTIEPVKGKHTTTLGAPSGPKRRTNHDGELREANETGYPQIVKWMPRTSRCLRCEQLVEDHEETINLEKRSVKCLTCGDRYSLDILNPFKVK